MRGMKALIVSCVIVGGLAIGNLLGIGNAHSDSRVNPARTVYTLNTGAGTVNFGNGAQGSTPAGGAVGGQHRPGSGASGNAVDASAGAVGQVTFDSGSTQG